jgi:hypothetical protein
MKILQRPLLFLGHTVCLLPITSVLVAFVRQIWDFVCYTCEEAVIVVSDYPYWNPSDAILPLGSYLFAFLWGFYILAYPPSTPLRRKLSIFVLAVPLWFAFSNGLDIYPDYTVGDTFLRFCYIWLAHMSHEVIILEFEPRIEKDKDCLKVRMREAYKVLFNRNRRQVLQDARPQIPKHNHTRQGFVLRHLWRIFYLFVLSCAYTYLMDNYCPEFDPERNTDYGSFFRRLPASLDLPEMCHKFDVAFDWIIVTFWLYDRFHSAFAILFVGILQVDEPQEWSMSLFGSVSDSWSVRRYWGKFWHNFVYHSLSAHAKIITRQWLGMRRGYMATRLAENTLVFLMSGLGHTLVRWVSSDTDTDKEIWCITIWYVAQMLALILESIVQDTVLVETRRDLDARHPKLTMYAERTIGYLWVCAWFFWTVAKYNYVRSAWSAQTMRQSFESGTPNDMIADGHVGSFVDYGGAYIGVGRLSLSNV